jgi:hypothetical protein
LRDVKMDPTLRFLTDYRCEVSGRVWPEFDD